jgi:hypothetical protein
LSLSGRCPTLRSGSFYPTNNPTHYSRLLAHAGFDARHAVRFWESRQETERTAECTPGRASNIIERREWERTSLPMRWMGSSHPMSVVRVARLKEELRRWEIQRDAAQLRLRQQQGENA